MTRKSTTICYYISSHGYGHAARACQVMAALPDNVRLIARTSVDPAFIARESGRKVKVVPGQFDTGVIQKDNRTLDWPATFRQARQLLKDTAAGLLDETDFLRKNKVDLVVCDVPPAPLEAARMAGIPSVVVGNFTWVEIFQREARNHPEAAELADLWREQYALATLAVRSTPAFPMKYFRHVETVEPIARRGKNRRAEILKFLGLPAKTRLVLLYFGTFGDDSLKLPTLPDTALLSFTPMPKPAIVLDPARWHFPDALASVHCVIAKPGYGTTGECMANGTPMIYHPRTEFAEYPLLREAIKEWGGGVQISLRDLEQGKLTKSIETAARLRPPRVSSGGAKQTAALLMDLAD